MTHLTKEKMVSGVLWAGGGKVVSMIANFVAMLFLARAISPGDYGIYYVGMTTVLIMASVGTLGMDQLVVRFANVPAARADRRVLARVVATCLGIVATANLVVSALFYLIAPAAFVHILKLPGLVPFVGILSLWVFFAVLQRQQAETFRGLNDIRMAALSGGVRNSGVLNAVLMCVVMLILKVTGHLTLYTSLLTMLGTAIAIVLHSALHLRRRLRVPDGGGQPEPPAALHVRQALHEGWPLGIAAFVVILNNLGSTWLASPMDTPDHLALFGISQRIMQVLIAPMMITNAVLPPIVAELAASGQFKRLERVVKSIGGVILLPSLVVLAILVVVGRPLLGLMFGPFYEAAYPILILVCVGQTINMATGAWQIVLPMTGNKHQLLGSSLIALTTQFVLGIALGLKWGVFGVAIAYCASITITNVAGMLFVHRRLGIWTYASLSGPMLREAWGMVGARLSRRLSPKRA